MLERRLGAWYLALLLTGETAPELGDDRHVTSVDFQQAPRVAVDDLVVSSARADEATPSLRLALGVRRRPNLVRSDESAKRLIVEYVRALLQTPEDGREHRLGLAVAGTQTQTTQLAELTVSARSQRNASEFFELLRTPNRFEKALIDRLAHVEDLIKHALEKLGTAKPQAPVVELRTWQLLRRLWVIAPRLEEPDIGDWAALQNRLINVARGRDLAGAGRLRDLLEVLAGQYAPRAATVDATLLRREVHALLQSGRRRHDQGWQLLEQMQRLALDAARNQIGGGETSFALDRSSDARALIAAADASAATVVGGDSGVGKSSLALAAAAQVVEDAGGEAQAVCLNLRQLPHNWLELFGRLGASLADVLSELSAPRRYLVVDGADAAAESKRDVFSYVIDAAKASDVKLVVATSNDVRPVIRDLLGERFGANHVGSYEVSQLSDERLTEIVTAFPGLRHLAETPRSRELLRRLVVIDLLVRSGIAGLPLSDADAMREIWTGLVRRREQRDRGLPDAREQVMLRVAAHALSGKPAAELDPSALDGLRQDGLLRSVHDNPWELVPEFAHDEIRRYAVARVLLASGDLGVAVDRANAPRWALSAATLAAQVVLAQPEGTYAPLRGRLATQQASFDAVAAAHGARWADVPDEALLTLGDPAPVLADAWPQLRAGDRSGLARLLRVLDQRHRKDGILDPVVAHPVVVLLLEEVAPWRGSEGAAALLREWLFGLVVADAPGGLHLRLRLQQRIVDVCEQAQRQLDAARQQEQAARAARSAEQQEQDREREEQEESLAHVLGVVRRRRRRPRDLPRELTDETVVELLALLGPDLGDDGEQLLRRVAAESPVHLAPALEKPGTGRALGTYGRGLLADLVEAYYLDEDEDGSGFHEDGIRRHCFAGIGIPMTAWYRGPFRSCR